MEQAFAEPENCVIVAKSTLELGIDVGDLDHVIQTDAPSTVASFLQRLGRTGRRAGTVRNCLFLAVRRDGLLRAAALVALWRSGYVQPIEPPPSPYHVLAQQLMGLALQEKGLSRTSWIEPLRSFLAASALTESDGVSIIEHMLREGLFHEDEGLIWFGERDEKEFGRRHFMDLMAVFAGEPMLQVRHGRTELGAIHPLAVLSAKEDQPFSLGGRPWKVLEVNCRGVPSRWSRARVMRRPAGRAIRCLFPTSCARRFEHSSPPMPSIPPGRVALARPSSKSAARCLSSSSSRPFCAPSTTRPLWWTFAGLLANAQLAAWIGTQFGIRPVADNIRLVLDSSTAPAKLRAAVDQIRGAPPFDLDTALTAADQLKFRQRQPMAPLWNVLQARYGGGVGLSQVLDEQLRVRTEST